eukprot:m.72760 g.72760  ORF g.72760 m.72760 type:complete len:408 (-) comp8012_c0_seq5:139-1362(-)
MAPPEASISIAALAMRPTSGCSTFRVGEQATDRRALCKAVSTPWTTYSCSCSCSFGTWIRLHALQVVAGAVMRATAWRAAAQILDRRTTLRPTTTTSSTMAATTACSRTIRQRTPTSTTGTRHSFATAMVQGLMALALAFALFTRTRRTHCSFAGDVADPVVVSGHQIYFRGRRILEAFLERMLALGMSQADTVLVHGCSAGGLSVYLHLDAIAARIKQATGGRASVLGAPESGFFMDLPDWQGKPSYTPIYQYVAKMQNVTGGVNQECVRATPASQLWKCFMAQYTLPHIKTPYFITNALYDSWQLANIVRLPCLHNLQSCSAQELAAFENLRSAIIGNVTAGIAHSAGSFLHSCVTHCGLSCHDHTWHSRKVAGIVYSESLISWFNGSAIPRDVDCQGLGCNPTC